MRKNILWLAVTLLVSACASQQLNYNALDIASSSGRLIKEQILLNLSIFKSDPYPPIVSQVSIPSGSVTTTNQASATITPPFGVAATTSLVNSAVAPLFNATTHTTLTPNGTIGLTGSDQWSQNLSINTITESGPQHRLAALYRYATGETNDAQFMCDYFLVQKQQGSGGASSQTTVNVSIANGQTHYSAPKAADSIHYTTLIPCDGIGKPDPSFLTPPDCVICDYNNSTDPSPHQLQLNKRLATGWLIFYPDRDHPESLPLRKPRPPYWDTTARMISF